MTVLITRPEDVAHYVDPDKPLIFASRTTRGADNGFITVVPYRHEVYPDSAGLVTTPDLHPGPATVSIGGKSYDIEVPISNDDVPLWPLIDAGLPTPPESSAMMFVRNGGGVRRTQVLTLAAYSSIPTPDPETVYFIIE